MRTSCNLFANVARVLQFYVVDDIHIATPVAQSLLKLYQLIGFKAVRITGAARANPAADQSDRRFPSHGSQNVRTKRVRRAHGNSFVNTVLTPPVPSTAPHVMMSYPSAIAPGLQYDPGSTSYFPTGELSYAVSDSVAPSMLSSSPPYGEPVSLSTSFGHEYPMMASSYDDTFTSNTVDERRPHEGMSIVPPARVHSDVPNVDDNVDFTLSVNDHFAGATADMSIAPDVSTPLVIPYAPGLPTGDGSEIQMDQTFFEEAFAARDDGEVGGGAEAEAWALLPLNDVFNGMQQFTSAAVSQEQFGPLVGGRDLLDYY